MEITQSYDKDDEQETNKSEDNVPSVL